MAVIYEALATRLCATYSMPNECCGFGEPVGACHTHSAEEPAEQERALVGAAEESWR